ncbi:MAG: methyltransferase domain-containing protein [Chloroflexi bacterium]|nr:methyltransferase domain-containing protein [Chloroflexota bacterium]
MSGSAQAEGIRRYYETDAYLRIEDETHAKYAVPKCDFVNWTLDTLAWQTDDTVLDIGCGRGNHYSQLVDRAPDITYYALDLSPFMLLNHPAESDRLALGDALQLPYADGSFDVVMANHVLYHLDNIDRGLDEIKRVLRPGGKMLATTNSIHNLPELQVLFRRAIVLLSANGAHVHPPTLPSDSFALENGTRILARHFYAVVRHDLPGQLIFDDIDPAMDYLDSMRDLRQHSLPEDVDWDDMMLIMRQQISQLIELMGKLELNIVSGALVASDSGGFINEFIERDQAAV